MTQADIVNIADAIVDALNDATLSQSFTAVRSYNAEAELQDLDILHVTVIPLKDDGQVETRGSSNHDYSINIGIQKKPATISNTDIDPLVYLTQEIADLFLMNRYDVGIVATSAVTVQFLEDHIRSMGQFTSVVTLTVNGERDH